MTDALYVGATGMRAHQTQVDTIANNVANVNTVGFRRETVNFSSVMAALQSGATDPLGDSLRDNLQARGAGAIASLQLSTNGGELKQTQAAARRGHRGQRILRSAVARRHAGVHARRCACRSNSEGMLSGAGLPLSRAHRGARRRQQSAHHAPMAACSPISPIAATSSSATSRSRRSPIPAGLAVHRRQPVSAHGAQR